MKQKPSSRRRRSSTKSVLRLPPFGVMLFEEKMSERASASTPWICSGDMYCYDRKLGWYLGWGFSGEYGLRDLGVHSARTFTGFPFF
jgi:hypothetical protein